MGQLAQPARTTRPALMHFVQAFSRLGAPFTTARTRWMFGSHRRFDRRCEWETFIPKPGVFPQMSQTAAMTERWYQPVSAVPGSARRLRRIRDDSASTAVDPTTAAAAIV